MAISKWQWGQAKELEPQRTRRSRRAATLAGPPHPVAAVPTLDALAANLPFADAPVCTLLYARKGDASYGEGVSMTEHGLQAALLAENSGDLPRGFVAALFGRAAAEDLVVYSAQEIASLARASTTC